eukprot:747219-Hanusia_phi.AAC.4
MILYQTKFDPASQYVQQEPKQQQSNHTRQVQKSYLSISTLGATMTALDPACYYYSRRSSSTTPFGGRCHSTGQERYPRPRSFLTFVLGAAPDLLADMLFR